MRQSKIMGEEGRGSSGWMRTLEEVRMGTGLGLGCPLERLLRYTSHNILPYTWLKVTYKTMFCHSHCNSSPEKKRTEVRTN